MKYLSPIVSQPVYALFHQLRMGDAFRKVSRSQPVYIFNFHRVRGLDEISYFDDSVFDTSLIEFPRQILWIKKRFKILSEDELLQYVENPSSQEKPCVAITFDDGYEDNFRLAFPILSDLEVPAFFFIPTHTIESRTIGWWDQIAYVLKSSRLSKLKFRGHEYRLGHWTKKSILALQQAWRLSSHSGIADFIEELAEVAESKLPSRESQSKELMTWDQIRHMSRNGMTIGSHTHSHSILSKLNTEEQRMELHASKSILESRLQIPIRSLAYPIGQYKYFNAETKELARECGYEMAFSYLTGFTRIHSVDRFDLRRQACPRTLSALDFKTAYRSISHSLLMRG